MKITAIDIHLLKKDLKSTMQISRGGFKTRYHLIVEVKTDAGISGLGEGVGNALAIKGILESYLANQALGLDPFDIPTLYHKLVNGHVYYERKGSAICAASAIEMACWDIQGKATKKPVAELLGGLKQRKLQAYVSDIYWDSPEKMADNARRISDLGFENFKIHIGHEVPERDAHRIEAVRHAIGNQKLMVDLNAGYDFENACTAIDLWAPFELTWLEEPLHPDNVAGTAALRRQSSIPIAAGENEFQVTGFRELFESKALDYAMPDLGRAGGVLESKKICEMAHQYGVAASPHNFSSGVLLGATLQMMGAVETTSLLEFDSSVNSVYHEFFIEPLIVENGWIKIPTLPGYGVHLTAEILEKYAVESSHFGLAPLMKAV